MRAAYYEKNGPAREVLRVGEIETPKPGPGEVRVKLAFSGVNPSDVKAREGRTRKIAFPRVIPHSDGAGEIDMLGDGVKAERFGERVWTWNAQWKRAFGTCAEYLVLPEAQAVRLPEGTSFDAAACLGIPALTSWLALDVIDVDERATLLIAGGAGAVAHYAIQIAKARKARVITTVSSAEKAKVARAAGADHVIDYKTENVGDRVMKITAKKGVDAVIELDFATNAKLLPDVLRPRGTVVVYGTSSSASEVPWSFLVVNAITLKFIYVYEITSAERCRAITDITRLLEAKVLSHNIAHTFALDDIVAAHEAVEQGKAIGNVVIRVG
jgi:NADPH2:quinone reductase